MPMLLRKLLVALTLSAAVAVAALGQANSRLLGVYAAGDGAPLTDAEVIDLLGKASMRTSATGTVSLAFAHTQHDSAAIQIRKFGYRDTSFIVRLGARDTLPISILLDRITLLETVAVRDSVSGMSAGMRTFDAHRKFSYGKFLTPAEMREINDGELLAEFLRGKNFKVCAVYVNGVKTTLSIANIRFARDVEAMEYYESALMAPAGYDGGQRRGQCPVLVIWLRER